MGKFVDLEPKKRITAKAKLLKKQAKAAKESECLCLQRKYDGQLSIFDAGKIKKLSDFTKKR